MTDLVARVPPRSLETERAVLGAILLDQSAAGRALTNLQVQDFYHDHHARVFEAARSLAAEGQGVDLILIADQLDHRGKLEQIGGRAFLGELAEAVATTAHIDRHCQLLRRKRAYRDIIHASLRAQEAAYTEDGDPEGIIAQQYSQLATVSARDVGHGLRPIGEFAASDLERIRQWQNGEGDLEAVRFGLPKLDRLSGGMVRGEMTLIGGRPKTGKTSLGVQIATTCARSGLITAIFSIEMTYQRVRDRIVAQQLGIPERLLSSQGGLSSQQKSEVEQYLKGLDIPLYAYDAAAQSVTNMRLRIFEQFGKAAPDVVVVDYLQIIQPEERYNSRFEAVTSISASLKRLAKDLNVPVLAISQLSRQADYREDKAPRLSDLRESGALEQDAALVLALKPWSSTSDPARIDVLANRYGPVGKIPVWFEEPCCRFKEV